MPADRSASISVAALLTPIVLLVHGYHPLADDGAIYVAGVKKLLNPGLFPFDSIFVLAPTHLSAFAPVLAAIVRGSHLPLMEVLLAGHLLSIFLFLMGCYRVAGWGAALLGACLFTLPVAGTSLSLMDPYVTARSFSTPFTLFAMAAVLEERWTWGAIWLLLAGLVHPLMAAYALMALLALALTQRRMWRSLTALAIVGWIVCSVFFLLTRHTASPAALSRSYFFLSSWQWFEYPGLVLPLLLLGIAGMRVRKAVLQDPPISTDAHDVEQPNLVFSSMAIAAALYGTFALLVSICFVHRSGSLMLARLQPLRAFDFVYLAGLLLAGGLLSRMPKRVVAGVAVTLLLLMFAVQRHTYAFSRHVEWPWLAPANAWQKAFLWIRANTPQDAIFALDNDYIETRGEDAQGFRATAERSALADYFKDGGIASNFPQAAGLWLQGSQATAGLNQATDAQRRERVAPLGALWVVLPAHAETAFACPYVNSAVRVCRLGPF